MWCQHGATVDSSKARSHLSVSWEWYKWDGFMMEFWMVDGILMWKNRKTVYLSIHLGSSYEVRISDILDQGNWDINTHSIIRYHWIIKSDKNTRNVHFLPFMLYLSWLSSHDILHIFCRVRMGKYLYGFLCIWENHILQNGEFVFILLCNRKPRTFSPREHYVQN